MTYEIQGAIQIFFNAYTDELCNILRKSGFGREIDTLYYGLIAYADDSALLAPSREALQKMLLICESYFDKHGIEISVDDIIEKSKTKCTAFNINIVPKCILLYNKSILLAVLRNGFFVYYYNSSFK